MPLIRPSLIGSDPFVIVDCGARRLEADTRLLADALGLARVIGFEPEGAEAGRLAAAADDEWEIHAAAVGKENGSGLLHETEDLFCSSLYPPDQAFFARFMDVAREVNVIRRTPVRVVRLDDALPQLGVATVDVLKLDTQGAEYDILQGAAAFLRGSVLAVAVEVQFAAIYQGARLFAEVDTYLRASKFVLFDLARARYRRSLLPISTRTRGQLLWGDAIYLRSTCCLPIERQARLVAIASALGFHDYALEVLDGMLAAEELGAAGRDALAGERARYRQALLDAPPAPAAQQHPHWID